MAQAQEARRFRPNEATGDVIGIDVGGTFTDCVALHPDGTISTAKVFTTPVDPSVGVIKGLTELAKARGMDPSTYCSRVLRIVHGTTVTTNAVLTNGGARAGLLTTQGFRDALEMRQGVKEEQYNNKYKGPKPLIPRHHRLGIPERIDHEGNILRSPPEQDIRAAVETLRKDGIEAIAVCFMHSYANPENERSVGELLESIAPDLYITLSADLLPQIRFYERTSTTAFNAYLGPILGNYINQLVDRLNKVTFVGQLLVMQSNGGVVAPENARRRAVGALLSGPAAGPIAGSAYASHLGYSECITVDMGGTSFDASVVRDGQPLIVSDAQFDRRVVALPTTDIHTIGAGGGSIAWIDDGGLLRMGPQSASADPGPACYGRGGESPTCTDADLILGYLNPEYFLGGELELDPDRAAAVIEEKIAKPLGLDLVSAAAGMYRVINVNMATGVRTVSVNRGIDPRNLPLVVAGGAGPVHAGRIAEDLGIPIVVIPRQSGLFCAIGMLLTDLRHDYIRTNLSLLTAIDVETLGQSLEEMELEGRAALRADGVSEDAIHIHISMDLRYLGQHREIAISTTREEIEKRDWEAVRRRFDATHHKLYGHQLPSESVEMVNLRLLAQGLAQKLELPTLSATDLGTDRAIKGRRSIYLSETNDHREADIYDGGQLTFGDHLSGPAVVEEASTTIFVPPNFDMLCDRHGSYVLVERARVETVKERINTTLEARAT